jgi:hypothetical protein
MFRGFGVLRQKPLERTVDQEVVSSNLTTRLYLQEGEKLFSFYFSFFGKQKGPEP